MPRNVQASEVMKPDRIRSVLRDRLETTVMREVFETVSNRDPTETLLEMRHSANQTLFTYLNNQF
ncbi:MAG TPA: hypothetical protein DCM07_14760 [Planctomycetaceae bacterium]|nr:hypothetical protein [Gimesia sp.]HAH46084.1 hypothetical protein [Planctomycetaceae bacterium]